MTIEKRATRTKAFRMIEKTDFPAINDKTVNTAKSGSTLLSAEMAISKAI